MSLLDKAQIFPVNPQDVCHYSKIALPFIKLAMEQSDQRVTLDSIMEDLANHERQLWIVKFDGQYIAAVVTMVYTNNKGEKVGEISLAGGSQHDLWDNFVAGVSAWFKAQGCVFIDIVGRKGWERLYKAQGFHVEQIQLRKAL